MADINQIITLGIGTPADIEHFILIGLSVSVDSDTITVGFGDPVIADRRTNILADTRQNILAWTRKNIEAD